MRLSHPIGGANFAQLQLQQLQHLQHFADLHGRYLQQVGSIVPYMQLPGHRMTRLPLSPLVPILENRPILILIILIISHLSAHFSINYKLSATN
jgi:hypothetical protein